MKSQISNSNSQNIKTEHSAGGCVYRRDMGQVKWLLGRHSGYHKWVLPKGLIEAGETARETAVREVKEEMGVEAKIIGSIPLKTLEYTYMSVPAEKEVISIKPARRVQMYQENSDFAKSVGKERVEKKVDFYLMAWVSGDPKDHDWEMEEAGWFDFKEAVEKLGFASEQEVLRVAHDTISK